MGGGVGTSHEEGALQPLEVAGGLQAEVADESGPELLVDVECLAAPTGAVQREHELGVEVLVRAVAVDQHCQFRQQFAVAPEPQIDLDPLVQGAQPALVQSLDRHLQAGSGAHVCERVTRPQVKRLPEQPGRPW